MMKIKLGLVSALISTSLYSQVGINTVNPIGILHVDGKGNTSVDASLKDDFIIKSDAKDGISVSLGGETIRGASIALKSQNKAFLPNRIELVNPNGSNSLNPIKNPVDGMVVYNTARVGVPPDNVVPGLYVYNAGVDRWLISKSENSGGFVFSFKLNEQLPLPAFDFYSDFLTYGSILPLTSIESSETVKSLSFGSEAAYAVSLNLDGTIPYMAASGSTTFSRIVVYVAIVLLDETDSNVLGILDVAEINAAGYRGNAYGVNNPVKLTYPIVLGFNAKSGQRIGIFIGQLSGGRLWTLAPEETNIVIWKV